LNLALSRIGDIEKEKKKKGGRERRRKEMTSERAPFVFSVDRINCYERYQRVRDTRARNPSIVVVIVDRPRIGFSFFFPLKKRPSLPPFELRINAEALSHLTILRMHFSVLLLIRCSMKERTEDSPIRRYVSSKASMAQPDKSSAISFGGIRGRAIKMFALIPAGFHVQIHDRGSLVHERGSNYTNDRQ